MKKELKLDRKKALLIGLPVFGLLVGLIGYLAFVSPQNAKGKHAASEMTTLQAQLIAAKQAPAKPKSVQAADLFRLAKAMPDSADMPGILRELSRLAKATKVTIETVKPSAVVPLTQGYGALPVNLVISGKFGDVSDFLGQLRRQVTAGKHLRVSGRLLVANQIMLSSTDGRSVTATLSLDAFVYGVAPPVVAPTTTTTAA